MVGGNIVLLPLFPQRHATYDKQLEKGLGSRPQLAASLEIDVPAFNGLGEQLAGQWPDISDQLTVGMLTLVDHV
jgi:hypothetical protein